MDKEIDTLDMRALQINFSPSQVRPKLILTVQYGKEITSLRRKMLPKRKLIEEWIVQILIKDTKINVRFIGEKEGFELNNKYRYRDYATNILTFEYFNIFPNGKIASDLVLCCPVIENEARRQNKTLTAHYAHLLIHGALHAQGHDHEKSDKDRINMETLECETLAHFGFANPY